MKPEAIIAFGPFRLDPDEGLLWKESQPVHLSPKSFGLLAHLARRPGRLLTKGELLEAVWPATSVGDGVLKVCIREIRRVLGDRPEKPRYIATVHRRGYRFVAGVDLEEGPAVPHAAENARTLTVGREAEIEKLKGCLDLAWAGRRQVAFVTGEPGIGKTTLVEALLQRFAARGGLRVARGQCLEHYGAAEPYLPWLDALGRLARTSNRDELVSLLRTRAPTWLAELPWLVPEEHREALQRELGAASRARMMREMAEALEVLSARDPLVLVLEDLHWSDHSTLDLVAYVARRREPGHLLLIGTYRPGEAAQGQGALTALNQELSAHGLSCELRLGCFDEGLVASYLAARFPGAALPGLAQVIQRRTDGHPLFMVGAVDELLARELIRQTDSGWGLTSPPEALELTLPEGARGILQRQVDRLTEADRRLLEAASLLGAEFSADALAAVVGLAVLEVEQRCHALARTHQLVHALPGGRYAFAHTLYREALASRIGAARGAHLHGRIGRYFEALQAGGTGEAAAGMAIHFEAAHDLQRAFAYFREAAENASRRFAYEETIVLARKALSLLPAPGGPGDQAQQEAALRVLLGVALMSTRGYGADVVQEAFARARDICLQRAETGGALFRALLGLCGYYLIKGELGLARELAQEASRQAAASEDDGLRLEAHLWMGVTLNNLGDFARAHEQLERGLSLYRAENHADHRLVYGRHPEVALRAFDAWALWTLGEPDEALARAAEALALARSVGHAQSLAFALFFSAFVHHFRREPRRALEHSRALVELSQQHGFDFWQAFGTILGGWALAQTGRRDQGLSEMQQGLAAYRATGAEASRSHFLGLMAATCVDAGRREEASTLLEEALQTARRTGGRYYDAELLRMKGELLLQGGDVRAAEATFRDALGLARRQQARSFALRAATSLGRVLMRRGEHQQARSELSPLAEWFANRGADTDIAEARAVLAASP